MSVGVRRRVSHVVSDQRLLALDDVSLDPLVVIPPLPEDTQDITLCFIYIYIYLTLHIVYRGNI